VPVSAHVPLAEMLADMDKVIAASEAAGSKGLVVEQDNPSMGKTAFECVKMSMDYLNSLK
jgi:hypothetical protein